MSRGQKQSNMIGQRFGRWLILDYDEELSKQRGYDYYLARCDCDIERVVKGNSLRDGKSQSCGCLQREVVSKICSNRIGENNPAYVHGFCCTTKLYESFRRDAGYKCQRCDKTQEQELVDTGQKLSVHHKDNDHDNNDPRNIEVLCLRCHRKVT